jgi:hypothetical protein
MWQGTFNLSVAEVKEYKVENQNSFSAAQKSNSLKEGFFHVDILVYTVLDNDEEVPLGKSIVDYSRLTVEGPVNIGLKTTNAQGVCELTLREEYSYKVEANRVGYFGKSKTIQKDSNGEVESFKLYPNTTIRNKLSIVREFIKNGKIEEAKNELLELERDYLDNEHILYYKKILEMN